MMFASGAGQRDQDQHGSDLTHVRSLRDAESGIGRTVTPERKPMDQGEYIDLVRRLVALEAEMCESGKKLAKIVSATKGQRITAIVDGQAYHVTPNYGGEVPVLIRPATVIG